MSPDTFTALVVSETDVGFERQVTQRSLSDLPDNDVLIRVHYSSLNYKDALSASGNRGVTRRFPHTPGIDAAGVVVESRQPAFKAGDPVIVIGYDLGMQTSGGFGEYIRVPAEWIVRLPEGWSLRESMIYGTAGFTAAQSIAALRHNGVQPEDGPVAVTGATGGVGSLAVAILAHLDYSVVAVTGKSEQAAFLQGIGAAEIRGREAFDDQSERPLLRSNIAAAVDTVGGNTLATLIKTVQLRGVVTCCGMVAGDTFTSSVFPFILRGVTLCGIDSGNAPLSEREEIWGRLANEWRCPDIEKLVKEVTLADLEPEIETILQGQQVGRVLLRHANI